MSASQLKLAITAESLDDNSRDIPKRARLLGLQGLQFDAFGPAVNLTELSGTGRREFSRLISTQNLELVGLRLDLGAAGLSSPAKVERSLDRAELALRAAADLAAPLLCIQAGSVPAPATAPRPKPRITQDLAGLILVPSSAEVRPAAEMIIPPPDPALVSLVDSALDELGRRADRYSVIVAFRSDLSSFSALHRAIGSVNCPWFGIDLDPAAILGDDWSQDDVFGALGERIRHVRGRDAVAGADRRTKPAAVGSGSTDWRALLANLDSVGYQGWITFDPYELADRPAGADMGRKKLLSILK